VALDQSLVDGHDLTHFDARFPCARGCALPLPLPLPKRLRRLRPRLFPQRRRDGLVRHLAGPAHRLVGELQVEHLQPFDLVPQPRRRLEFQVAGGVAHLAFEVAQGGLEVVAEEGFGVFGEAGADGDVVALVRAGQDVLDAALDAFGGDAVVEVELGLLLAAAAGFAHGPFHRAGDGVGVEDDLTVDVAGRAADGLDQAGFRAEEALLVGVENGDQAAFGDVEALAQQVDADQDVEGAQAEVADDLDAFEGVDVAVHVADPQALLVHVFGEVLGHLLGQDGDQGAVAAGGGFAGLGDDVVDLAGVVLRDRADLDRGVAETWTVWGRMASHSSNLRGRLSRQLGRRKPYSARFHLRL
jgi:hypothetical protein